MESFPTKTIMASLALGLAHVAAAFTPVTREDLFPSDILVDYGPGYDAQTENTIHQLAVSDFIFKGMVQATNDGFSAELNVEDAIWGCAPSSNITVRCVDPAIATGLVLNRQYLILSYTNNWWADSSRSFSDNTLWHLCNYVSVTSRPPEHAVFPDCRIINPVYSAIAIDIIDNGSSTTNYWYETRAFITNFIDFAKIQLDEKKAHDMLDAILYAPEKPYHLPEILRRRMTVYKIMRYGEHAANTNFFIEASLPPQSP